MRTIRWSMIALVVCLLVLTVNAGDHGGFVSTRTPTCEWHSSTSADVVAFDWTLQVGSATPDTFRLQGFEVYDACVDGVVPPGVLCSHPFSVAVDGLIRAKVRAVDLAGNVSPWDDASVTVDTEAPVGCTGHSIRE